MNKKEEPVNRKAIHPEAEAANLRVYSLLKDKALHPEGIFIAEGRYLVERLLCTDWPLLSVVCTPALASHFRSLILERCPLFIKKKAELEQLTGFPFHRGVLAACKRPLYPAAENCLSAREKPRHLVILPHISETENIGSIFRSAAAFGIQAVLLGKKSCDPFSRKALRCAMGSVFWIPIFSWEEDLPLITRLRALGYRLIGATLSERSLSLPAFTFGQQNAVILGNEAAGLPAPWEAHCDDLIKIPLTAKVDSLNVGVAAGIVFYELYHKQILNTI